MKKEYLVCFLVLLWLKVHIVLTLVYGHRDFYDAMLYLREADFLLATKTLKDSFYAFYITHIATISFFRWLVPGEFFPAIVFQCMVSGLAILLLYRASIIIFNNHRAAFFAGFIFLCWWDNIHWNITLMTESLACSLSCFLIYALANFRGRVSDFMLIVVLLLLGFFTRPTGVIPIIGAVIFLLTYYWALFQKVPGLNLSLIACFSVLAIFAADQMFLHWDFTEQYVKGNIVTYMNTVEGTALYEPSLQLDVSTLVLPPSKARPIVKMVMFMYENPIHFVKASILKFWYLVSGTRPYYSIVHNAFTLTWVVVVYFFFFLGWKQLKGNGYRFFVLTIILVNCFLVSISTVDWDNRFYIPMEPVIVLVAGRGVAFIVDRYGKFLLLSVLSERDTKS